MELVQNDEINDTELVYTDLISVVIPVFNVERYLQECVESVRCQSYGNLEVILVDDGSTDRSGIICDEYSVKDKRIKVIHKQNGGLSEARNTGINAAEGEYLIFIDSDDYIAPQMIQELYSCIVSDRADISICGYMTVTEEDEALTKCDVTRDTLTEYQAQEMLNNDGVLGAPFVVAWNKLYKKHLFSKIRFPVEKIHEDVFIMHKLFSLCDVISTIDGTYYFYRQRNGSITKREYSSKNLDGVEAYYQRYCYYRNQGGEYRNLLKKAGQRFAVEYYYAKVNFKPQTREEKGQVKKIDKMASEICFDLLPQWSLGMKMKLLLPKLLFLISQISGGNR